VRRARSAGAAPAAAERKGRYHLASIPR